MPTFAVYPFTVLSHVCKVNHTVTYKKDTVTGFESMTWSTFWCMKQQWKIEHQELIEKLSLFRAVTLSTLIAFGWPSSSILTGCKSSSA